MTTSPIELPELAAPVVRHLDLVRAAASLRDRPDWAPISGTLDVGNGWKVWSWEEPRLPGDIGQDATLIASLGTTTRLGVIDAAENQLVPDHLGVALRATHTARAWLRCEPDPVAAIRGASSELCDPDLRPRHRNPIASVAFLDLDRSTGRAIAYRADDCEIWFKRDGFWEPAFLEDTMKPDTRAAYDAAADAMSGGTPLDWWPVQESILDEPDVWNSHAVGLVPNPTMQVVDLGLVDEVIVSTDGARLDAERCASITRWMTHDIQSFPRHDWPHQSPHGDLAVLHLFRG